MPAPSNLPAALFRHAGSRREEPWLFRAEGWDWRWRSWGEVAREVQAQAERLAAHEPGSRIAFPYAAGPEAVVLDLAIQAAGLVAVPTSGPAPSPLAPLPSPPFPPHRERGKLQERSTALFDRSPSSPGEGGGVGTGEMR